MIRESLCDQTVVGGNLDVRYEGGDWVAASFTWVTRWRRRVGIFYGDSGIFCRRSVFELLGGFRPWPVLEDYDFARRLRKAGRLALLSEHIWVSDRRWRNAGVLSTLWSWFWIQMLFSAGVHPDRLSALYRNVRYSDPVAGVCPGSIADPADPSAGRQIAPNKDTAFPREQSECNDR